MSGLCLISKHIKQVVTPQLNVSSNGLENIRQPAYKLGHSTKTALLSIKNDVHLALATVEATAVVLLDQSAVFELSEFLVLHWWCSSGLVHVLPL